MGCWGTEWGNVYRISAQRCLEWQGDEKQRHSQPNTVERAFPPPSDQQGVIMLLIRIPVFMQHSAKCFLFFFAKYGWFSISVVQLWYICVCVYIYITEYTYICVCNVVTSIECSALCSRSLLLIYVICSSVYLLLISNSQFIPPLS